MEGMGLKGMTAPFISTIPFFMNLTNNSTIILNESQMVNLSNITGIPQHYPANCDPLIDLIQDEGGKLVCYHQVTIDEAMRNLIPAFILFFLISTYISFKIVVPYITKKIKERQKK